jgi:uncharacterized Tic20 family protein
MCSLSLVSLSLVVGMAGMVGMVGMVGMAEMLRLLLLVVVRLLLAALCAHTRATFHTGFTEHSRAHVRMVLDDTYASMLPKK